jgi:hypothetical protein
MSFLAVEVLRELLVSARLDSILARVIATMSIGVWAGRWTKVQ